MSLIEHGFCSYANANEVITFDNLVSPFGRLPLNTSGGNLAECYMHGLGLVVEAVRQVRGDSSNQVPNVNVSFVNAGPMVEVASAAIFGRVYLSSVTGPLPESVVHILRVPPTGWRTVFSS